MSDALTFQWGDLARYGSGFLRNTGQYTDSDGTHQWAKVVAIRSVGHSGAQMVTLRWHPLGIERNVLNANLERKRSGVHRMRARDLP